MAMQSKQPINAYNCIQLPQTEIRVTGSRVSWAHMVCTNLIQDAVQLFMLCWPFLPSITKPQRSVERYNLRFLLDEIHAGESSMTDLKDALHAVMQQPCLTSAFWCREASCAMSCCSSSCSRSRAAFSLNASSLSPFVCMRAHTYRSRA